MARSKDTSKYLRCLPPSGEHKSYRFQEQIDGKWKTIQRPEIDALNSLVKQATISQSDAIARADVILKDLYAERDKANPVPTLLPGNEKILQDFLKKTYTPRKKRDMAPGSYRNEVYYLQKGLLALDNLPIDGALEKIQNKIDKKFERNPRIHKRRTTSVNRIRLFLGLEPVLHMKVAPEDIVHLSYKEVNDLIDKLKDPYKTLAAVAFYTGMRRGEIFAITEASVRDDVVNVYRQMYLDGTYGLPKHGKKHKAFIIPGGQYWLKRWLEIKGEVSRHIKVSEEIQSHAGVRFHDLRHSTAVYLIAQGATLDWVAQSLGHTRETCERYYSGFVLDDDAITLMRNLFKAK